MAGRFSLSPRVRPVGCGLGREACALAVDSLRRILAATKAGRHVEFEGRGGVDARFERFFGRAARRSRPPGQRQPLLGRRNHSPKSFTANRLYAEDEYAADNYDLYIMGQVADLAFLKGESARLLLGIAT